MAKFGDWVEVHFTLRLTNEEKFDSSLDRGQPFSFQLGQGSVIKGWDEGMAGMKEGGKRKLIIPAELGYGSEGADLRLGKIPKNAGLILEVQLLKIKS
jgi:FKBP-type peptidyl-prolyl cis-trans isomerase